MICSVTMAVMVFCWAVVVTVAVNFKVVPGCEMVLMLVLRLVVRRVEVKVVLFERVTVVERVTERVEVTL